MRPALGALAVGLAAVLAGCSAPGSPAFHATASMPHVLLGYDYGAATAQASQGAFEVTADAAADTATVRATFTFGGRAFQAASTRFAETPGRTYQEGGIRSDFQEHGATGNGDALLPAIHAVNAGWGTATLTADGQPFADPASGATEFALHYMVTDTAPRDPESLQLTQADGAGAYDPADPGNAAVHPGTWQVLLNLQSPGAARADAAATLEGMVAEAMHSNSAAFDVNATGARVTVNVSVANPTPLPTVARLSFVLTDPAGQELGRFDYDVANPAPAGTIVAEGVNATGTYALSVSGAGVGAAYRADILVHYPPPLFLHVVYTDVQVG